MRRLSLFFFSILTLLFVATNAVHAQSSSDFDRMASESALGRMVLQQMSSESSSNQFGPHFRGGENVVANDTYSGDLYIGAGSVQMGGTVSGDLLIGGGSIFVDGSVAEDVRIAGGNITFNGDIGGNVTVLGGSITFSPTSTVKGSVVIFGGNVTLQGAIDGNVYGGVGAATLNGLIGQNVSIDAGTLTVSPSASISGSLVATVQEKGNISPNAQIIGSSDIQVREKNDVNMDSKQMAGPSAAGLVGQFVFGSLMSVVGGLLLLWLLPSWFTQLVRIVEISPGQALGWGLVFIFMMPIAFIFLLITVIGIPLAFLTLLIWICNAIIASWISAYVIGRWLADKNDWSWIEGKYTQLIVGALVLNAVSLIPIVGWLLGFAAFVLGMGSLLIWIKSVLFLSEEMEKPSQARVSVAAKTSKKRK